MSNVLFLIDNESLLPKFKKIYFNEEHRILYYRTFEESISELNHSVIDLVVIGDTFCKKNQYNVLSYFKRTNPLVKFIVLFQPSSVHEVIEAHNRFGFYRILDLNNLDLLEFQRVANQLNDHSLDSVSFKQPGFREEIYTKELYDLSSALNSQIHLYRQVRKVFEVFLRYYECHRGQDPNREFVSYITDRYIQFIILRSADLRTELERISAYSGSQDNSLQVILPERLGIRSNEASIIILLIDLITKYYSIRSLKYKGILTINENKNSYDVSVVLDAIINDEMSSSMEEENQLLVGLMQNLTARSTYSNKNQSNSYKFEIQKDLT